MSNDITLSDVLINNLYNEIVKHDETATQDMMVALQYFSAVSGYLMGEYPGSAEDREQIIDHLTAFSKSVAADRAKELQAQESPQAQPQAAAGRSEATDDPAVGIWKPE